MLAPWLLPLAVAALTQACEAETLERTQVMVRVDADAPVRGDTRVLRVDVFGGPRGEEQSFPRVARYDIGPEAIPWPVTIALAPADSDPSRRFRLEARALDPEGEVVVEAVVSSGYIARRTLALDVLLRDTCRGRTDGPCAPQDVDPTTLADFDPEKGPRPRDAGMGASDGGGASDAASPQDGGADASSAQDASMTDASTSDAAAQSCTQDADCRDENACNGLERCVNEACVAGTPLSCPNDSNPCTEAVCVEATGCAQQAISGSCDDGNACTVADSCSAGTCQGSPKTCGTNEQCVSGTCACVQGAIRCNGSCVKASCCSGTTGGSCACGGTRQCVGGAWQCQSQSGNCSPGQSCIGADCVNHADNTACASNQRKECHDNGSACLWSGCF